MEDEADFHKHTHTHTHMYIYIYIQRGYALDNLPIIVVNVTVSQC